MELRSTFITCFFLILFLVHPCFSRGLHLLQTQTHVFSFNYNYEYIIVILVLNCGYHYCNYNKVLL
ncbi:hypothetical protein Lalb_Chr02g0156281 [Lupinus albus]|uniref:Uncharacterized protein n=1 Tax=Lupinus albus TaxID=3870 RepID=A0A6A4R102_LUPAL|nr:hypothetical protein Lalb_Chr02g0156281 [Lupinus albus]